ncbi:MAG: GH3 auxin-responsive promoter family protein [bacterium]|nr:GH3 auxin-responsive promoter family protein [bacterium]
MSRLVDHLLNAAIRLKMYGIRQSAWPRLMRQTHTPQAVQNKLLQQIVANNQRTTFGRQHRFDAVYTYAAFCQAVPIQTYEDLRPYIEAQEQNKNPVLYHQQPVMYAQTSGTTGEPKYIPILKRTMTQHRRSQALSAYAQYQCLPGIYQGKILAIVIPAIEGHLATGTPYGSMSGIIHNAMPGLIKHKFVVPSEVFEIEDYELKYRLIAGFGMAEPNITTLASANPSTLLKLLAVIQANADRLLNFIATGDVQQLGILPGNIAQRLQRHVRPNHTRASALQEIMNTHQSLSFGLIWPRLQAVVTWTGGNCSTLLPRLTACLPPGARMVEMGYLSSEFRGSINVDIVNNRCIPTLHENFFEFVERQAWDNGDRQTLRLEEVKQGEQYYVIITTQDGLYRYAMNDIIEVSGRFHNTPTITFVQKGKGVTNLTGEKLYESQLVQAMQGIQAELNTDLPFFMLLACPETLQYFLFIELPPTHAGIGEMLERRLAGLNVEFDAKRKSGRLLPLQVVYVKPGTEDAYKRYCIENGQREGQFKLLRLQYADTFAFDFTPFRYD